MTDVTEFKVDGKKLYLSPAMDLYNGEILAYSTSRRPLFNMVSTMLNKAFARLGPKDRPLLHCDQGWQHHMDKYRECLDTRCVTQSMSRKGNCLDNAAMESFFGTLKSEFFHLNKFINLEELKASPGGYIRYYHRDRVRLKLKRLKFYRISPKIHRKLDINCLTFWGQFRFSCTRSCEKTGGNSI